METKWHENMNSWARKFGSSRSFHSPITVTQLIYGVSRTLFQIRYLGKEVSERLAREVAVIGSPRRRGMNGAYKILACLAGTLLRSVLPGQMQNNIACLRVVLHV
jgi:hypothetical protein